MPHGRAVGPERFTVSPDGHYVGQDGFILPKDFGEFFERDPLRVRRWVTKRVRRGVGRDAILDLEQDLLLYLCRLPPESGFRRKGANGRPDGCADVIQCFNPGRHFGATAGRFHKFINVCLANRLNTILSRQRLNPICDPRSLSIAAFEISQENASRPESAGRIDEAFLLKHSGTFASESRRRALVENPVLKTYIREFEQFVVRTEPKLLDAVHAIQRTGTLRDAEKSMGMGNREFRRCRRDLTRLKSRFLEEPKASPRVQESSSSLEIPVQQTTKVFLREELYERVWTTPMHRLAKEFGYSDVGLAKVCEKHNIPRPGLGYWRRVELGQKPPRPPLPAIEQPNPYRIEIVIREPILPDTKAAPRDAPAVPVSPDGPISHPAAVRSERLLRNGKKDESEILVPRKGTASHLRVTEVALPRALGILDAFFVALEARGMQIAWPNEENASLQIVCESESIGFALEEILDRKAHAPTEQEAARHKRDYWWSPPKWDYQPTGLLRISLLSSETTGARRTWSERKERSLETQLGAVVVGISVLVESIKKVKAERQRWHEEFEAKQKRRREEEERAQEFARRGEVISKAAQALHQSQLVRRLAVCLGNSMHLNKLDNESLSQMRELLEWCSEYANSIDPTCQPDVLLRKFYKKASGFLDL
jgi:hypothetical protein